MQGTPALDLQNGTVTFNVSVIADPKSIKFSDGIARQTYNKAAHPNTYAKVLVLPCNCPIVLVGVCPQLSAC